VKYKVVRKHKSSKDCLVCGYKNDLGLKASFYELENGEIVAIFKTLDGHQSYPGRTHGGMIAAILDETIGRAINITEEDIFGVTVELDLKYKKPVPLNAELKCVGRITRNSRRIFEGTGEILLPDGEIAATAFGKYMKMPVDKISDQGLTEEDWMLYSNDNDPTEIEL
jgi:acyl-coenzyme A thioesterase PaaI-like protein